MDSGSWGLVLDGSMKEVWNGEMYVYFNYGDKLKDYFDIGFLYMYNVFISNGIEKLYFCIFFGYFDNDGVFFIESLSCVNVDLNVGMELNKWVFMDGKIFFLCIKVDNCLLYGDYGVIFQLMRIFNNVCLDDLK